MKTNTIEIDNEVLEFLKKQAEPFVDTPNDVLRRLLLRKPQTTSDESLPKVEAGIPKALEQILQVIFLVCFNGYHRSNATKKVAEIHNVATQTVLDKYCRQLNLTASEFDKLLAEPNLITLKPLLIKKFQGHSDAIDVYLNKRM